MPRLTTPTQLAAAQEKAPTPSTAAPLLADAKALAELLGGVGLRTIRGWDAAGKLPRPVKIGGRTLWNVDEVRRWIDAGAPDRAEWEARKRAEGGHR